ncbi:hypothetical protein LLG96_19660 [bacterium]|nr:hypothetical protein [bacterium]
MPKQVRHDGAHGKAAGNVHPETNLRAITESASGTHAETLMVQRVQPGTSR